VRAFAILCCSLDLTPSVDVFLYFFEVKDLGKKLWVSFNGEVPLSSIWVSLVLDRETKPLDANRETALYLELASLRQSEEDAKKALQDKGLEAVELEGGSCLYVLMRFSLKISWPN